MRHSLIVNAREFNTVTSLSAYSLLAELPHCHCVFKLDSIEAIQWCQGHNVDLVLVDFQMPVMDGLAFADAFRQINGNKEIPLIMIASAGVGAQNSYSQSLQRGANDFIVKPINEGELLARVSARLTVWQKQRLALPMIQQLDDEVDSPLIQISAREMDIVYRLAGAAECRDGKQDGHIFKMAHYCRLIAKNLGLTDSQQALIYQASPLHDIGKLGIPDAILHKPSKLTEQEFSVIQDHTLIGGKILQNSASPLLQMAHTLALTHHEKFDGSGYPYGLRGDAIPLSGRITAIGDVFTALTCQTPYKDPWPLSDAISYLQQNRGTHFDPRCVDAFLLNVKAVMEIYHQDVKDCHQPANQIGLSG